jgi:hypothetical protein
MVGGTGEGGGGLRTAENSASTMACHTRVSAWRAPLRPAKVSRALGDTAGLAYVRNAAGASRLGVSRLVS